MTAFQIIKTITEGQKINLSELARTIGISPQTLHNYWNGYTDWPFDVFQECLEKLDHRIDIIKNSPDI